MKKILVIATFLAWSAPALAATAVLNWTNATTNVDGSPIGAITGIAVLDNGAVIATAAGPATTFTTSTLSSGTHVFTVETVTAGGTSVPSNSVPVTILVLPNPPIGLTVLVQP